MDMIGLGTVEDWIQYLRLYMHLRLYSIYFTFMAIASNIDDQLVTSHRLVKCVICFIIL